MTPFRRRASASVVSASVVFALGAPPAAGSAQTGQAAQSEPTGLGPISFPTSGSAEAQPYFLRGVAALHNFEYEEANEAFQQAQQLDPRFALAYWGEALTYSQTLWRNEDVYAGRQILARLGPTPAVRASRAALPKEKGFLAAAEALFGDGDAPTRHQRYAEAMAKLYATDPDDPEVASFYALSLLGTMARSLIGYIDAQEGRSSNLAGSETQREVGAILDKVLKAHPEHPGALHYLLHVYDDPEHARLALRAARTYAKVAPASSHALHMPAHIFFQLGMWHEASASDRAAFDASDAWVKARGYPPTMRSYHALSWLQYELLQLGRYQEARATMAELEPIVKSSGELRLLSDLSSMRARYVLETRRWEVMARERNFGNVNDLFAIGVSAARLGNAVMAERARQALAERSRSALEGDLRPAIVIMERELAALMELAAGRAEQAVTILEAASKAEQELPPPFGLPAPIKPAPELLGEVLLEIGRPADAVEPFTQALARNPNRSLSVLGLARAAVALGDADGARQHYQTLLTSYDRADADLPELQEARAAVATIPSQWRWSASTTAGLLAVVVAVGAMAVWVRRRRVAGSRAGTSGPGARARGGRSPSTSGKRPPR